MLRLAVENKKGPYGPGDTVNGYVSLITNSPAHIGEIKVTFVGM